MGFPPVAGLKGCSLGNTAASSLHVFQASLPQEWQIRLRGSLGNKIKVFSELSCLIAISKILTTDIAWATTNQNRFHLNNQYDHGSIERLEIIPNY